MNIVIGTSIGVAAVSYEVVSGSVMTSTSADYKAWYRRSRATRLATHDLTDRSAT